MKKSESVSYPVLLFGTWWTVAHQAYLSMKFSRQEYWNRLSFPSPGDLPDPGIKPGSPAWQADSLLSELQIVVVSCQVVSNSAGSHGLQHARYPRPSPSPGVCPGSRPSIELVMPSNHLILYRPLLLLSSLFPSIRVFCNESGICIRWPKHWSFSFSISLSKEYSGLISSLFKGLLRVCSTTVVQNHQFFSTQPSLLSSSHIHT